ncbi:MAG: hypothetical protein L6Q60_13605, partial [Rhodocyclaceae bacterium]|nr:hypothetical protein [Rhodocyclaceae bacterium]
INLRFPGQYYDQESGMHYNWHRVYDPAVGRYLSPDPIGVAGGVNLYSYVGGNPLGSSDPTGLIAGVDDAVVIGGVLIVGAAAMSTPQGQKAIGGAISGAINAVKEACPCFNYTNVYEPNDGKHGSGARSGPRGTISPEPINGAAALASSVPVGNSRIGHDPATGQLIVFRNHRTDEQNCIKYWHGYVVGQKDLTPDQWRAGRNAGFPDWPRKPQ